MNNLLDIELNQPIDSFKTKWELIKITATGSTVQYSARKQKSKCKKVKVLEKKNN